MRGAFFFVRLARQDWFFGEHNLGKTLIILI